MTERLEPLDLPGEDLLAAAEEVCTILTEWRAGRDTSPVLEARGAPALFETGSPPPRRGTPLLELLAEVRSTILPACRRNDAPGFFGYVCSGGSDAGTLADFLAAGLNQNVTAWRSAPGATEMERLVVEWLRQITGMPEGSEGLLLGGGSSATLAALAAARDAMAGADVAGGGLLTLGREMTLYASDQVHMSVGRAAALLGLGREALRTLPSTESFTLDVASLERAVAADRREGRLPFCVIASAGSTATGAIDPIEEIASYCAREGLWLHVDGAYGGLAALSSSAPALAGLERADSLSVDPHKWLHVPFDCGALLVSNPSALRAPFSEVGSYARTGEEGAREAFTFFERGPELSRRFRALKLWMLLRHAGTDLLGKWIDHDISLARRLAARIEETPELELMAPVMLSTVCFRYAPGGTGEGDLDALNRGILGHLQSDARVYPTHAVLRGRFALRACILNPRTREKHVEELIRETLRHGSDLRRAGRK